jgi:ligand-binding sensor domain-containing protein
MVDYVQDVWDAQDGLPHPGVTLIRQTKDGYLWVATFSGVVRFDGVQFTPPAVTGRAKVALGDHVRCFLEASDGAMWFGTRREGAVRLLGRDAQVITTKDGLPTTDVRAIAETKDGTIWLATTGGLVARDRAGKMRVYVDELPARNVGALLADDDGTLWAGTNDFGLVHFDGRTFERVPLPFLRDVKTSEEAAGIGLTSIAALARDAQGALWAATSVGLVRIGEHGAASEHLVTGAFNALWPSRAGALWVSTGGGLGRYQNGQWRRYTSDDGVLTEGIHVVFEDREGSVWVGTRIGLARLRPRLIRTYTRRDGLAQETVTTVLATSGGVLWAGTGQGASRLADGRWTTIGAQQGLPHPAVRTFAEDKDGAVWIGTLDGLVRYKDGRATVYRGEAKPYSVRGLAFDAQGRLWIGAADRFLDRLDGNTIKTVLRPEQMCDGSPINYLYHAADDSLWMGRAAALLHIVGDKVECLKDPDVLSRNDIRAVTEDTEGRLWVGSIGGLSRVDGGRLRSLARDEGPFGSAIYSILDDGQGAYWYSTPRGIYRVKKEGVEGRTRGDDAGLFRVFGTADGMESSVGTGGGVPNACRLQDGRLAFATATGVAVVDPSRMEVSSYVPPVYVESLVADHHPVDLTGRPRLAPGTRDVELHFALLSFIAPERSQYRYQLEGHDPGWVDGGSRRVAYYSNLTPGRHKFRVMAANHNGVWNETGATLEFDLAPRFYETRWFMPLVALLLASTAAAAYRIRVAALRARAAELQRSVDEALANVQVLSGLLPICASCRRVREDTGYWRQIEAYVQERSSAKFSHGVCPDCWDKMRQEDPGLPAYGTKA